MMRDPVIQDGRDVTSGDVTSGTGDDVRQDPVDDDLSLHSTPTSVECSMAVPAGSRSGRVHSTDVDCSTASSAGDVSGSAQAVDVERQAEKARILALAHGRR